MTAHPYFPYTARYMTFHTHFVSSLHSRVVLYPRHAGREGRLHPGIAHPLGLGQVAEEVGHIIRANENLEGEARARVPGDVAVQQPAARVVGLESQRDEAAPRQHRRVAARRVVVAEQRRARRLIPWRVTLGQNHEVATVQVDRVVAGIYPLSAWPCLSLLYGSLSPWMGTYTGIVECTIRYINPML